MHLSRPMLIATRVLRYKIVLAERVGFEPTLPFRVNHISSVARSTTLPPLQLAYRTDYARASVGRPSLSSVRRSLSFRRTKRWAAGSSLRLRERGNGNRNRGKGKCGLMFVEFMTANVFKVGTARFTDVDEDNTSAVVYRKCITTLELTGKFMDFQA